MTKRIYYGNSWFLPPFRTHYYWVEDAEGKSVAEAASINLAEALAETLNYVARAQAAMETVK